MRCAWRKDEDVLAEAEEDDVVSDWGDAASVVSGWDYEAEDYEAEDE